MAALLGACRPEGWEHLGGASWYAARSVPAKELTWETDPDFVLENVSVPSILVLHEGAGYRMFLTDHGARGDLSVATSADGDTWDLADTPVLTPEDFGGACGPALLDAAVVYLRDGRYRLLIEGQDEATQTVTVCSAVSADGDVWEPEDGAPLEPGPDDDGITSVMSVLWWAPWDTWVLYYVGAWTHGNGIRVATSEDGARFVSYVGENVLQSNDVDPDPVRLGDDEAIRLYHTHTQLDGQIGQADAADGAIFTDGGPVSGLGSNHCAFGGAPSDGDECRYDPFYLRLPDGRMHLYYGSFETTGGDTPARIRRAIGR